MDIIKPTEEEMLALRAEHAHRFPASATFSVVDRNTTVSLPVLLGNPSGACKMPIGKLASTAWGATVASTFKMRPDADAVTSELAADCVLSPNPEHWARWVQRWPALPERVQVAVRKKTGARLDMLLEPAADEACPEKLAPVVERTEGAVWRRYHPTDTIEFALAIAPPSFAAWRLFVEAMKRRDGEHATLAREIAEACVVGVVDANGEPTSKGDLLDRWCGAVLLVGLVASHLAGVTAEYELGE